MEQATSAESEGGGCVKILRNQRPDEGFLSIVTLGALQARELNNYEAKMFKNTHLKKMAHTKGKPIYRAFLHPTVLESIGYTTAMHGFPR